jgi:hypothetical protein
MAFVTPEDFVRGLKLVAFDSAVAGTIMELQQGPPGRGRHPRGHALHVWCQALADDDRSMIYEVVRNAAHAAIFNVLCVLDGVAVIDDPPHVELALTATREGGEVTTLASGATALELHDEFNSEVHPYSESWPPGAEERRPVR